MLRVWRGCRIRRLGRGGLIHGHVLLRCTVFGGVVLYCIVEWFVWNVVLLLLLLLLLL